MDKKLKLFMVVTFILCFLVYLYLRRRRLQENFECAKIDNSLFCIKDKGKIDRFRSDMDPYYKPRVQDMDFYNYIKFSLDSTSRIGRGNELNYRQDYTGTDSFKNYIDYKNFGKNRLNEVDILNTDEVETLKYKYDFIHLDNIELSNNKLILGKNRLDATRIATPGGVLFDKYNDDIIVFDAYRIRRFSYRDMKIKDSNSITESPVKDYYPVLDAYPLEIYTQDDLYRRELCEIVYAMIGIKNASSGDNVVTTQTISYKDNNRKNILIDDEDLQSKIDVLKQELLDEKYKNKDFTFEFEQKGNSEIQFTTKSFLERVKFLEEALNRNKKYTKCVEDLKSDDKKCSIKYQRDLPSFDMGPIEGTGVEGMQYDDDKPPTIIHSTYIDNRMEPWSNSWNNIESEGVFSPLVSDNSKRMKIFSKDARMAYRNFKDEESLTKITGNIDGVKQQSIMADTIQIFNKTTVSPLARGSDGNYLDERLGSDKKINFHLETFQNKKAFDELNKQPADKNKINYGYPSLELNRDENFNLRFSIGVYNIPDELDCTGIGMEIVDIGDSQIILVPDTNNNRVQVFKKDKSELTFYGQFGNLPYTSYRSLPIADKNHSRYEQIHDTENHNSLPGCKKTCDFDTQNKYQGSRDRDFMNRKCLPWGEFQDENIKINKQQINKEYMKEGFKQKDFLKAIRDDLKKGATFGSKCQSLESGHPVCIVDDDGQSLLSKCFPDFYLKESNDSTPTEEVKDLDTCTQWMDDYTSRFGPIDANLCMGDNQSIPLTPQEIKEGKMPVKDCVFECDNKYSYRRANIHHRQTVFREYEGDEKEVYRKRGHFYSLLDEYQRCKNGIDYEKKNDKKAFEDAEFINPHFLGVDSQACIGKKTKDGDCTTRDTRNTSGVDNCSLAYRKYLLKVIAATNQGQKYGQLFHPKSIAYDDVDKKYYVVDCYHHSIQCYNLEEDKDVTESGEKLKFVSADAEYNDKNVYYYDENFQTAEAMNYNSLPIYSLGLRQNLLYDKKFENFSRKGIVSDDKSQYIIELNKYKKIARELDSRVKVFDNNRKEMIDLRKIWRETTDETKKDMYTRRIIDLARDIQTRYFKLKNNIERTPLIVMEESLKRKYISKLNEIIKVINSLYAAELNAEVRARYIREKRKRVANSVQKSIPVPGRKTFEYNPGNEAREYPNGYWANHSGHAEGWLDSALGYAAKAGGQGQGSMIIKVPPDKMVTAIIIQGRRHGYSQWIKRFEVSCSADKNIWTRARTYTYRPGPWPEVEHRKRTFGISAPSNTKYVRIKPMTCVNHCTFRAGLVLAELQKGRFYNNRRINDNGDYIDSRGRRLRERNNFRSFTIQVSDYLDQAVMIRSTGTAEESPQNKKFSKEKGFSEITGDWGTKYSDSVIRLNRWVSGVSSYGNHVFAGFKEKIDYEKIKENGDYYFNTVKGGGGSFPGCGEFSYPSDIAIAKNTILGDNQQLMFVTDTGNNRISIFKKYKLDGEERFRFYSFLGDEEEKPVNKKFVSPISVCVSEVSGNVFVLESNLFNNNINRNSANDSFENQRIKVFYCDKKKKNYFWSHNIELMNTAKYQDFMKLYNSNDNVVDEQNDIFPRITKIRIDDRGILALTDINNNKVHLLKESMSQEFKINNIDDSALNKVVVKVEYDPYKKFKTYEDRKKNPILNHDRVRFIFQRQRVCAFQSGDMILSREYKTGNMPFTNHKKSFEVEDVIQELEYDNCWVMNTDSNMKYIPEDIIETDQSIGKKLRKETNLPNFEINKKYNEEGILVNYEDWRGRSLEPNSSYFYKIYLYNYHFVKNVNQVANKIVQTYPVFLKEEDVVPKSVFNKEENFINLGITYDYDSKKYNPICFTIMRRIHNRSADICTKNLNCVKQNKIQLFIPAQSKNIYQIKSRPKFGRLMVYDIDKGGEFEENIFEMERSVDYSANNFLIFYSCEGGDEKVGGVALPDSTTIGRGKLTDSFTLGDKLESVHTQITYNINIDITKSDNRVVLFKDNETVDEFVQYYQENPAKSVSTDLRKLIKLSFAKELENGGYAYPGMIEYCDKGINDGQIYEPIEMNQTYEYVILVSNPFKVNPAVNSFYYTTKPEKPYIHSVEFEKKAMEDEYQIVKEHDVAKITWYYPKNRSLYWPLNFLILRKDISKKPVALEPTTYNIDFTFVAKPLPSDNLFRITKNTLKLLNNSDPSSTGTLKRRYNLGKLIDWRIKLFGTPGIKALVNGKTYDWSEPYIEFNSIKFLDLAITLKGQQQITNITCEETVVVGEDETATEEDTRKLGELKQFKVEQDKKENMEIKEAVEEYRKSDGPNFIFRLGDDYHGYYTNVANAPKTGRSGSLYNYIKDMDEEKLLNIYDELSDEMKIYSGDVGLRMDGEGRTLRSGDKQMIIDKIRHFAFILRENQKTQDKVMGIDCGELNLNDIEIVTDTSGEKPKIQALICKNMNQPRIVPSESPAPSLGENSSTPSSSFDGSCSTLEETGLSSEPTKVITDVRTLEECCQKLQLDNQSEVAEFKQDEEKCEIHKSYDHKNEVPNRPNSTLLGKTKNTFELPPKEEVVVPAPTGEDPIFIPPGKSEWEIIKVVERNKRTGNIPINLNYNTQENFEGNVTPADLTTSYTFRPSLAPNDEEISKITNELSFNPTIVSLSSDPEGLFMPPSSGDVEFSSHEILIPVPRGRRYAYKVAVYQTGFCMDTKEKKRYLGVETNSTKLGMGEIYSNELELGESIQETIITNKPPLLSEPVFKEPKVDRPVIKFFEPKEGDANSIVRIVGLKLDEIEYFCFRDVKVPVLKKQERVIGNVKYQEYLFKPPSVKELNRKCWQSIEKYRALVWGYHHGYQIISSEGNTDSTKMFTYTSTGECQDN